MRHHAVFVFIARSIVVDLLRLNGLPWAREGPLFSTLFFGPLHKLRDLLRVQVCVASDVTVAEGPLSSPPSIRDARGEPHRFACV